jgi:hypothetical protein
MTTPIPATHSNYESALHAQRVQANQLRLASGLKTH